MFERIGELVGALFGEVGKLREANQEIWHDLEVARKKIRSLDEMNLTLHKENKQAAQQIVDTIAKNVELNDRVKELEAALSATHSEITRQSGEIAAWVDHTEDLTGQNELLSEELATLKTDYKEMTGRVGGLTGANQRLEAELAELRAVKVQVEDDLQRLLEVARGEMATMVEATEITDSPEV